MGPQLHALRRGVDVVVATPGRALDHIRRKTMQLKTIQMVVLDEADEMLDMGFAEDLDAILEQTPKERQTALFSATMPSRIAVHCQTPPQGAGRDQDCQGAAQSGCRAACAPNGLHRGQAA